MLYLFTGLNLLGDDVPDSVDDELCLEILANHWTNFFIERLNEQILLVLAEALDHLFDVAVSHLLDVKTDVINC